MWWSTQGLRWPFSVWLKPLTLFQMKTLSPVVQTVERPGISAQDLLKKEIVESYYCQYRIKPHVFNLIQMSIKKENHEVSGNSDIIWLKYNTQKEFLLLFDMRPTFITLQYQYCSVQKIIYAVKLIGTV